MNKKHLGSNSGGSSNAISCFWKAYQQAATHYQDLLYSLEGGLSGLLRGSHKFYDCRWIDFNQMIDSGQNYPEFDRGKNVKNDTLSQIAAGIAQGGFSFFVLGGGNGSSGLYDELRPHLSQYGIRSAFVCMTIDADAAVFAQNAIGCSTAVTQALIEVSRLRRSLRSNTGNRIFIADIMGRDSGFITLYTCAGSGGRAFLIPEELKRIPEEAVEIRKSLEIEYPNRVSVQDIIIWLALSHIKMHCVAQVYWDNRFIFFLAEGVKKIIEANAEDIAEAVTLTLSRWGVSEDVHYRANAHPFAHSVCRDQKSDAFDSINAFLYGWAIVDAFYQNPDWNDIVAYRENAKIVVKPRVEVLPELGPFPSIGIDLATNNVYKQMAKIRERWMLSSQDLALNSSAEKLRELMCSFTNLEPEKFLETLQRVAWLGDSCFVPEEKTEEKTAEELIFEGNNKKNEEEKKVGE